MSANKKLSQQELMKKFLEEKKNNNFGGNDKAQRPNKNAKMSVSKSKQKSNGGGLFDSR